MGVVGTLHASAGLADELDCSRCADQRRMGDDFAVDEVLSGSTEHKPPFWRQCLGSSDGTARHRRRKTAATGLKPRPFLVNCFGLTADNR